MAVIEARPGNQSEALEPRPGPIKRGVGIFVAGLTVGLGAAYGLDVRHDMAERQAAHEEGFSAATTDAQEAIAAAQRLNAWMGRRLVGSDEKMTTGMLGGTIEFLERGEVTSAANNPLIVASGSSEADNTQPPQVWALIQEVQKAGTPTFRPVWLGSSRENMRVRLWDKHPVKLDLQPCLLVTPHTGSAIGACAIDPLSGQPFSPSIFPGLREPTD